MIPKKSKEALQDIKIIKIRFTGDKASLAGSIASDAILEKLGLTYKSIDRIASKSYVK
jgi:hypothetical protein